MILLSLLRLCTMVRNSLVNFVPFVEVFFLTTKEQKTTKEEGRKYNIQEITNQPHSSKRHFRATAGPLNRCFFCVVARNSFVNFVPFVVAVFFNRKELEGSQRSKSGAKGNIFPSSMNEHQICSKNLWETESFSASICGNLKENFRKKVCDDTDLNWAFLHFVNFDLWGTIIPITWLFYVCLVYTVPQRAFRHPLCKKQLLWNSRLHSVEPDR